MTIFSVLEAPGGKPEDAVFVPEGFSWGAFLFSVLWALWQRMWVVSLLLFAVLALLVVAVNLHWLESGAAALCQFGVALLFGFEARSLQVQSLERAGFRLATFVQASTRQAAELTHFFSRASTVHAVIPTRYQAAHNDTLGLFGNV
ncbi:DUF2628 domain-containing protein [Aestuariivirga sp.]|uniref:DUF2628 domain-containing protein n=1 Tax=Aestuariivirga sp. TaxID=2650926 RepID=UPI003BA9EB90